MHRISLVSQFRKYHQLILGIVIGVALSLVLMAAADTIAQNGGVQTVKLVSISPKSGSEVPVEPIITMEFSGPVISSDQVGQTVDSQLIKFSPEVIARYTWRDEKHLALVLDAPLRPSTRYVGRLDLSSLSGSDKIIIWDDVNYEISTPRLTVTRSEIALANSETGLANQAKPSSSSQVSKSTTESDLNILLGFNYPVDPKLIASMVSLTTGKTQLDFTVSPDEPSSRLTLGVQGSTIPANADAIQLTVARDLTCIEGQMGLVKDYSVPLAIPGSDGQSQVLTVDGVYPEYYYWGSTSRGIAISLSESVDASAAKGKVHVSPVVNFTIEPHYHRLVLRSSEFRPGQRYEVSVDAGLISLSGSVLGRLHKTVVVMPDADPSVEFSSPGIYTPDKDGVRLSVDTVNISEIQVDIYKIFDNNIVPFLQISDGGRSLYDSSLARSGQLIGTELIPIKSSVNETISTTLDLGKYIPDHSSGVYAVMVCDRYHTWRSDSKMVITSGMGITVKTSKDDILAMVSTLKDLSPVPGASVTVLSSNNQTIASGTTGADGVVHFTDLTSTLKDFSPYVVIAETPTDMTFISLDQGGVDKTDFDVGGRDYLERGYEAFAYMDRDIFRPGDSGHIAGIVRGTESSVPPSLPVKITVVDPSGSVFRELTAATDANGAIVADLDMPSYAKTGEYRVDLLIGETTVGTTRFSIEEFMPERIKVEATTDKETYVPGETAQVQVSGQTLYGPPASRRRVELAVTLKPVDYRAVGYASYTFGAPQPNGQVYGDELLIGESTLDDQGYSQFDYAIPDDLQPPSMLKAVFHATVLEDAGRPVSSYYSVDVYPYDRYVGVKAPSDVVRPGEAAPISYTVLSRDGTPVEGAAVRAEVCKVIWNSIYKKGPDGRYRYQSEEQLEKVSEQQLTFDSAHPIFEFVPGSYGLYRVILTDVGEPEGKPAHRTSIDISVWGFGYFPYSMKDPGKVGLEPDKKEYEPGDTARIGVKAPFPGTALVTVEREKVLSYQVVKLDGNTGEVEVPINRSYLPNVYVSVQLIKAPSSGDSIAPSRAFGTISIPVSAADHRLTVTTTSQGSLAPKTTAHIDLHVEGGGGRAAVTLAAVDEGICQLTGYRAPSPFDFFFGKKALRVDSYDMYDMVLPDLEKVGSDSAPGGDADRMGEAVRMRNLNPVSAARVRPVSLWTGIVQCDESGNARVDLEIPEFTGTLRLMAVAFDGSKYGSLDTLLPVTAPIVINPTLPRFLSSGDEFTIPVAVLNSTGAEGTFDVSIAIDGPVSLDGDSVVIVPLSAGEERTVEFKAAAADGAGTATFDITVSGNGASAHTSVELPVRPSAPSVTRIISGVATQTDAAALSWPADLLESTGSWSLEVAPFPSAELGASIQYLLSYPYGCLEQTTSRLFPLLYYRQLSDHLEGATGSDDVPYFIDEGILKIESMQMRDGSFSYWPGGDYVWPWASVYASHFLVEARKAGYIVSDRVYDGMIGYLSQLADQQSSDLSELERRVYALYVLSLAGKPKTGTMTYIANNRLADLSDAARAQLAAAFMLSGDQATAKELLPRQFTTVSVVRQTAQNLDSDVSNDATVLDALATIDPANPAAADLVRRLSAAVTIEGRWPTTHDNAVALMALGKILGKQARLPYQGRVLDGDNLIAEFASTQPLRLDDDRVGKALENGSLRIEVTGEGAAYYSLTATGVPVARQVTEVDSGIAVRRTYLDRDGNPVDTSSVRQGDLVIVDLGIQVRQGETNNVVIADLLPAGFEIDNPRLGSNADLSFMQEQRIEPDYLDVRDDRMLVFASFPMDDEYHFYYAVRAVTKGVFALAPVKAECMYSPEIQSISGSGTVTVR